MIDKHPPCPEGHPLVVRKSNYGKFFGCLTYPEHKIIVERPDCPNGHIMSIRTGPYGEFFGCTEYPNCDETYNFEIQDSKYHAKLWQAFENSNLYAKTTIKEEISESETKYSSDEETLKIKEEKSVELGGGGEELLRNGGRSYRKWLDRKGKSLKKNNKVTKFSKEKFKYDLSKDIEKSNFSIKAKIDKNHPEVDTRLPKSLTKEEKEEYSRLHNAEYSNHLLLKVPNHLLPEYLRKSLQFKRELGN
tara:strand:+ start:260 stop:1000 length:741 start_codon:yes stop_codon:yes gene_type:complete